MSFATVGRVPGRRQPAPAEDLSPPPADQPTPETGEFGEAGDRPPIQNLPLETYAATATLLQPALHRDPTAQIDLIEAGLFSRVEPLPLQPTASLWPFIGRLALPFLTGVGRSRLRLQPPPPQQRPTQIPPKAPFETPPRPLPEPSTPPPLPPPFILAPNDPGAGEQPKPSDTPPPNEFDKPAYRPAPSEEPGRLNPDIDPQFEELPTNPRPIPKRPTEPGLTFIEALSQYFQNDNRGSPMTTEGNRIIAEECADVGKKEFPELARYVEHVGGSYKDGDLSKYLKELIVGNRRPDLSWILRFAGREYYMHLNTATMRVDGTLTVREQSAFDDLVKLIGDGMMHVMRKLRIPADRQKFREEAREKCRGGFRSIKEKFEEWKEEIEREGKTGDQEAEKPKKKDG